MQTDMQGNQPHCSANYGGKNVYPFYLPPSVAPQYVKCLPVVCACGK